MTVTMMILAGMATIMALILYVLYANQISNKNTALSALSSIEVQLRKRYDLIPQLLKLAKRFMAHEKALLEEITELRGKAYNAVSGAKDDAKALFDADTKLASKMGDFKVSLEAYPELKSEKTVQEAMVAYRDVEDNIAAARRFYNAAVTNLNNSVETFPGNLLTGLSGASLMEFYQDAEKDKIVQAVDVDSHL